MAEVDLESLPATLRGPVRAALPEGADCEEALEAIGAHLREGGARTPALLFALATLTFEDAHRLVLHRISEAGREALRLLDEARSFGSSCAAWSRLEARVRHALDGEAEREARLRRALDGEPARPTELVELAHVMIQRKEDDRTAAWLLRRACGSSGTGSTSGVFQVPKAVSSA